MSGDEEAHVLAEGGRALLGNGRSRRRYSPLVLRREALGITRNLFPKSVDYIDGRRTGHKMRFILRINAAARKLREAESNNLARFQCQP
jgi:hypothetical protein